MMELLLIQDVEHLGKRGDKVTVKRGYARNNLLPLKLAVHVNDDNLKMVEKARVKWLAEEAKLIEELRELAGHIAKLDLKIVGKASDAGHLYGSVTEKDIASAAHEKGVAFDAKHVRLDGHIKEVGNFEVPIRLHEQVSVTIPVRVRAEGREDWLPEHDEVEEEQAAAPVAAEGASAESETPETDATPSA